MSNIYFREIIFPPLPKLEIKKSIAVSKTSLNNQSLIGQTMFDRVWCSKKNEWYSLIECINCNCKTRTLEEILDDNVGCI